MDGIIGYCGIVCDVCPALKAKKENDDELRNKTAKEWSEIFKTPFKPEDINCDGCTESGQHIAYCESMCEIRQCAMSRNVTSCAKCEDYGCEKLTAFLKNVPDAKKKLEELRNG
jgi:hypothetical protein